MFEQLLVSMAGKRNDSRAISVHLATGWLYQLFGDIDAVTQYFPIK